jgi:hypothetical protein
VLPDLDFRPSRGICACVFLKNSELTVGHVRNRLLRILWREPCASWSPPPMCTNNATTVPNTVPNKLKTGDAQRVAKWKAANKEKDRAYHRELMRKRRAAGK